MVTLPIQPDLWLHASTIDRLRRDFFHPRDPMVGLPGIGNPYFSPYMVFWAAIGLLTHLGTFTLLKISAFVNLAVLLLGVGIFTRSQSRRPSAPIWALASMALLWGTTFMYWSGFLSLPTLVVGIAYPSTFAVGLSLVVWTQVLALLREPRDSGQRDEGTRDEGRWWGRWWARWLIVGILAWVILLTHQFTALGSAIACGFFLLDQRLRITRQKLLGAAIAAAAVLILALVWPWFSVLESSSGADMFNELHDRLYANWVARFSLLLVALPVLVHRLKRNYTDALALTALSCLAISVYGGVSDHSFLIRALPTAAIMAQVAVGIAIASWLGNRAAAQGQRLVAALCVAALLVGALGQSGVINLLSPGDYPDGLHKTFNSRQPSDRETWLKPHVGAGETIMAENFDVSSMVTVYGPSTVRPAWPDPFLGSDAAKRKDDTEAFFDADTSTADRRRLAERYQIDWVVADKSNLKYVEDLPELELVDRRSKHHDENESERYLLSYRA